MKAIVVHNPGPQSELRITEVAVPVCAPGEVLIDVKAAGVNRADLLQREGKYPPPLGASELLGLEVSGIISEVGEGVCGASVGDGVCALLAGGGYAAKVSVPVVQTMPIPDGLSFIEAAAIPEAFITAYVNVEKEGGLRRGERVLIHGGGSGVGTAAIQLARKIEAHVACTVGSDAKIQRCKDLGAECVVNYKTEDFAEGARRWAPDGVDVILDIVGKEYLARNLSLLGTMGRLVQIATMSGAIAEINLSTLMSKRIRLIGSVLRSRSIEEKGALMAEFFTRYGALFSQKELLPVVSATFSLSDVESAHEMMRRSDHVGKIVLEL
jgi:putative PIG3 family NAD(P)H quinone oxidoreductase